MTPELALTLIETAIPRNAESWADVGAGTGTFTHALAELLGPSGVVYAVDHDPGALRELRRLEARRVDRQRARIVVLEGDFTSIALPEVDGVLAANALHFVPMNAQASVLARLAATLHPGGRVVVIEYDREQGNRWVPFPISRKRLAQLSREAGLEAPRFTGSAPSDFAGEMYVATLAPGEQGSRDRAASESR